MFVAIVIALLLEDEKMRVVVLWSIVVGGVYLEVPVLTVRHEIWMMMAGVLRFGCWLSLLGGQLVVRLALIVPGNVSE